MIKATDITKSFGPVQVLRGIDFSAADREVISIVGASGAGKSTLLQILGSLSRPDTGKVLIDGTDIFSLSSDALADFRNRKIGFVFQFHHLLPEFTALENVMIPALIARTPVHEARRKAEELRRAAESGHSQGRHQPSFGNLRGRALRQPRQPYQERHPPAFLRPARQLRADGHHCHPRPLPGSHVGPDAGDEGWSFLQLVCN